MQTSNTQEDFRSNDPVWVLLAELSLGDFLSDPNRSEGPTTGFLLQTVQELGMSAECMENIAKTLAGSAREAVVHPKQGRLEFPGRIRIFCQRKIIDNANSAKPSQPSPTEQGKKQKQVFPEPRANTTGGWGYFSIERGGDVPTGSTLSSENSIYLYLYKEGE